jgi:hypothetical protein
MDCAVFIMVSWYYQNIKKDCAIDHFFVVFDYLLQETNNLSYMVSQTVLPLHFLQKPNRDALGRL